MSRVEPRMGMDEKREKNTFQSRHFHLALSFPHPNPPLLSVSHLRYLFVVRVAPGHLSGAGGGYLFLDPHPCSPLPSCLLLSSAAATAPPVFFAHGASSSPPMQLPIVLFAHVFSSSPLLQPPMALLARIASSWVAQSTRRGS